MKIAIAGYGLEGESSYNYWANQGHDMTIVDEKQPSRDLPPEAQALIGEGVFEQLDGFDMVIRTAGLAPRKIKSSGKVWSATNEFFATCEAQIIGVTGSKGKGTTASLIASMLEAAGKKVWLVGNIGVAGLDVLADIQKDDIVVYELSSFQLWDIESSPHVGVVLFIEQEHLDVHASMDEYVAAKARITLFQDENDTLIFNKTNHYAAQIASSSRAFKTGYPDDNTAHVKNGNFYYGEHIICSVGVLQIQGAHNQENACAAIDAVWGYTKDIRAIEAGLRAFVGLPHRLQLVKEVDGISYYDDSIATTPSSAIAALRAFDVPKVIILGGSSKGSDFTELGVELTRHDVQVLLIGDEAPAIAGACRAAGFVDYEIMTYVTMQNVVERARNIAKPGGVVLLSPASASFGLFKNYADRGEQFSAAVSGLDSKDS
ncbi:MAG TPA: UDP-N-acetylmuramoyl-L-alanine--D-glutamate ligase [Candidatus Saccharimonadales bacterium]|nr:UDP-N-acetylmuramoyl-L-alanine--D-glutamate ligase [Candidatus Saccharimonadales bacterium]